MSKFTLHEYHSSGNCYKIRLTASLVKKPIERLIQYDVPRGETRTEHFLTKINPNGGVPVLQVDEERFIPESAAASYYIATGSYLIPTDPFEHAQMLQWMFYEQYNVEPTIAVLRYWTSILGENRLSDTQKMLMPGKRQQGTAALDLMNNHLSDKEYFVGGRISLADVMIYGYVHMSSDAGYDLKNWPHISKWCKRIEGLEGYISIKV